MLLHAKNTCAKFAIFSMFSLLEPMYTTKQSMGALLSRCKHAARGSASYARVLQVLELQFDSCSMIVVS